MNSTAHSFVEPGQDQVPVRDRMAHPVTGARIAIDGRLLLRRTWVETPELAHELLRALACQSPSSGLRELASHVVSLIGGSSWSRAEGDEQVEFLLVLGHSLGPNGAMSSEMLGRLMVARELHLASPGSRLMLSGSGGVSGFSEALVMREWLSVNGVALDVMSMEAESMDTVENVEFSVKKLQEFRPSAITLVTGSQHMLRAHVLLDDHLRRLGLSWNLGHRSYIPADEAFSGEAMQVEFFLLFKDLGRIRRIWDYPDRIANLVDHDLCVASQNHEILRDKPS